MKKTTKGFVLRNHTQSSNFIYKNNQHTRCLLHLSLYPDIHFLRH